MPGFKVGGIGSDEAPPAAPFYKYTWEIDRLFGKPAKSTPLIYAKEASLPAWDVDIVEVLGASLKYKFAGHVNFGDVKITWYDTDGMADLIMSWRDAIWTPDNGINPADSYKSESSIKTLSYDGAKTVTWKMINSWPRSVRVGDLTYSDSDVKSVEATIVYDWAERG